MDTALNMIRSYLTAFCVALCPSVAVQAQEYNIQNVARLDILPGYETQNGHMIAARIQLAPGWKTYWRAPGGNGIPPSFDWSGSQNLGAVRFHWPEPSVFETQGVRTIGYKHELVLPISITPQQAGKPVSLQGEVQFGVCEDVCLPVKARFTLNVKGTDASSAAAIKDALNHQPQTAKSAGISTASCEIAPIKGGFRITASIKGKHTLPAGSFTVMEFPHPEVWIEQNSNQVSGKTLNTSANLYAYGKAPLIMDRSRITMTVLGGPRAVELRGCPS